MAMDIELLRRLEQRRFERRLHQKAKKKYRNSLKSRGVAHHLQLKQKRSNAPQSYAKRWFDVEVPKVLDLLNQKDATCDFFDLVRSHVRAGRRVRLIFQDTQTITPEALIFLLGQVHRLRLEYGEGSITGTYPTNKKIERLLEESGFFHVLKVNRRGAVIRKSRTTRYLKFKSDTKVNAQEIPNLRNELLGSDLSMPPIFGRKVYRALSEAMTNVNHHAYLNKELRSKDLKGRWWLSAQLSVRSNLFTLTFYDAGVGIPKTLPRRYAMEIIRGVLSLLPGFHPDDGQMIKAAVALGRTRTDAGNRGKGLMDLLQLIDTVGSGSIWILSRCGSYKYGDCGEGYTNSVGFVEGTLIKWDVPLERALVSLPEDLDDDLD